MGSSYFDLDEILMEEEQITVVFLTEAVGAGILDPGSEDNNIEAGSKVELPFWLVQDLCHKQAVSVAVPNYYNDRLRKEIKADPGCVDLRSRCPYFYELGCKLIPLSTDKTLGSFLMFSLRGRYKDVLCKAHSAGEPFISKVIKRLTKEEQQLFEAGRESMQAFRKWRAEGIKLEKAAVLGRKRRLASVSSCLRTKETTR